MKFYACLHKIQVLVFSRVMKSRLKMRIKFVGVFSTSKIILSSFLAIYFVQSSMH